MKKLIGLLILALSAQGLAAPPLNSETHICTAQYQDTQLTVKFTWREHCLRCDLPQVKYYAQIIAPFGPGGTNVTQNYAHTGTKHYRLTEYAFKQSGEADHDWTNWFPKDIVIYAGTFKPLYLDFNDESLNLTCN